MMVTFEGGPAVGKTTVAEELAVSHGCCTVAEVNQLFGKEKRVSNLWYYQKQVERWALAFHNKDIGNLSILDGDVFQPIWFNAIFHQEDWGDIEATVKFFSEALDNQKVSLPDLYVYFHSKEAVRAEREKQRSLRLGRSAELIEKKIARYRDFCCLQKAYFSALNDKFPGLVMFLQADEVNSSIQQVLSFSVAHQYQSRSIFDFMVDWCRNRASMG